MDRLAGDALPGVGDLGELHLAVLIRRGRAVLADDDAADVVFERPGHHHAAGQSLADHPGADLAARDVGEVHLPGRVRARKVEAAQLPDGAATAIAAHQVLRRVLAGPVRSVDLGHDAVVALADAGDVVAPANLRANFERPVLEHFLDLVLRYSAHSEMRAFEDPEVHRYSAEMP